MSDELGKRTGEFYKQFVATDVNDKEQWGALQKARKDFQDWVNKNLPDNKAAYIAEEIEHDMDKKFHNEFMLLMPF